MGEIYSGKYFFNRNQIEYDYGYYYDYDELIKSDKENNELINSIRKIRQEGALQLLYASLDIDEKRKLMDLILNDTNLL